ncbi:hypothetical protein IQ277_15935, partial [Nostocales cyanobacterium LEGE 12452]|nr:hypothetical protein [Nostocales cyanobacterium LEGE 12452]
KIKKSRKLVLTLINFFLTTPTQPHPTPKSLMDNEFALILVPFNHVSSAMAYTPFPVAIAVQNLSDY